MPDYAPRMISINASPDERFTLRALELASKGIAMASPNPRVGAVVVNADGEVIGEGFHMYDGLKHAEVLALEQAGNAARGATLYLNLEPCSHEGRTGPCADAVIAAGIKRVVCSMPDPNPLVAGRGFAKLREAGVELLVGVFADYARKLNEGFSKRIRTGLPLVTLKAAMTLDGKIAPPPAEVTDIGFSQPGWITSEIARAHVQELRHAADSIMIGVGTVVSDNPLLTDRTGLPRRRPLLRVVLDSQLRLPLDSRLVKTAHHDVLVFCSFAEEKKRAALEERGIQVEQVPLAKNEPGGVAVAGGRPDLNAVVERLGARELNSLIVEGGAAVNWAALAAGIVDKVFLYYAPKILGGGNAVPFALGPGYARMDEAAYLRNLELHRFGEDFAVEGYLRDPYSD
ncbi:5-amino-6-(5-phosphoribosylamino)uracil reductase [Candidatus Koribacter versatilis Ellin345]|uniref:Riboflavin biosynthesis protein RibD n=1 Tax=Koribacter versatilis (strain Ellin345) TaxID=204669 RepID=Q1ILB2_KORVE|nr:bifunctional diaminohydroxyphosphoribosylaminopyrimidine deaminase/5-amino-6-(5-phosphoribosylamino)uracil reductase RibD [Candidatus Koribacter versatilis]ABF42338.1 5-amino-6-(5-phosphoribosylamino)uracil reductase [Candidatus Koribacter versatilis Ellin345]